MLAPPPAPTNRQTRDPPMPAPVRRSTLLARAATIAVVSAAALTTIATATAGPLARAAVAPITAIGAENEYADVIAQIGGRYVRASAIESNPTTDPHTFEASPSVAREVAAARLIVQNGLGYDTYMNNIESG